MTSNTETILRRDGFTTGQQYLEANVQTASPQRLRLMLIDRAVEVAARLSDVWRTKSDLGSNEHSIKLLELLNELLGGVVGGKSAAENELCLQVADLYVFLAKHVVNAEASSDAGAIDEIKTILEIEAETWRAVCAQNALHLHAKPPIRSAAENRADLPPGGLNLEG